MRKHSMAQVVASVLLLPACGMLAGKAGGQTAPPGPQQEQWEYGYSYMRLSINGNNASNLVHDAKYAGWLTVENVEIANRHADKPKHVAPNKPSDQHPSGDLDWWEFLALESGRQEPGKTDFRSGDDGGFGPVIEAMKKRTVIPKAQLDFYDIDHATFVGKYRIKGTCCHGTT